MMRLQAHWHQVDALRLAKKSSPMYNKSLRSLKLAPTEQVDSGDAAVEEVKARPSEREKGALAGKTLFDVVKQSKPVEIQPFGTRFPVANLRAEY